MKTRHDRAWHWHPGVRTGDQLKFREHAADVLKAFFGTWTLFGLIIAGIIAWMSCVHDPGWLHLNLSLSFLASVQGVILQIAANRGDRVSSEVAKHTYENTAKIEQLLEKVSVIQERDAKALNANTELTEAVEKLTKEVHQKVVMAP